jgi:hypothetical protein
MISRTWFSLTAAASIAVAAAGCSTQVDVSQSVSDSAADSGRIVPGTYRLARPSHAGEFTLLVIKRNSRYHLERFVETEGARRGSSGTPNTESEDGRYTVDGNELRLFADGGDGKVELFGFEQKETDRRLTLSKSGPLEFTLKLDKAKVWCTVPNDCALQFPNPSPFRTFTCKQNVCSERGNI